MSKILMFFVACAMIVFASCGSQADYETISKKIDNKEQLNASDYSAMVDYLENAYKSLPSNSKDPMEAMGKMEKDYPYMMDFALALGMADATGSLDSDLKKRLDKMMNEVNAYDYSSSTDVPDDDDVVEEVIVDSDYVSIDDVAVEEVR